MAAFNLDEVQRLVAADRFTLAVSRCRDEIRARYRCTTKQARAKFQEIIASLDENHFSETTLQQFDDKFDVYGARCDGCGWYVKVTIRYDLRGEEEVLALSCHPLLKPIKTKGGVIIP